MKNWEVVRKKISEMNKDEIIGIVNDIGSANLIKELLDIDYPCKSRECNKNNFECAECMEAFWEEEYTPPKQEFYIVHRTLRTKGVETYASYYWFTDLGYYILDTENKILWGYEQEELAQIFSKEEAIRVRDSLNVHRIGKQNIWTISKLEE